jgi:hypothetical protein
MHRFFNSASVADPDPEERFEFSKKQLKAVFKREKDPYRRALEVVRFPEAGTPEATALLLGLLKDREPIIRLSAAEVLGRARQPESIALLLEEASKRGNASKRVALFRALADLPTGTEGVVEPLLNALEDKNDDVRLAAVYALGNHPDRRSVEPLIALLAELKPRKAVVVMEALGKITGQNLRLDAQDWTNWWTAQGAGATIEAVQDPCEEKPGAAAMTVAAPSGFSDRFGKAKTKALRRNGGTKQTENSVSGALQWLARHQSEDGHWDTDAWALQCDEKKPWERVTKVRERKWDVRMTGLALMAFLGAGHTHMGGDHPRTVRRGLEWLKKSQVSSGYFSGDHTPRLYSHAAATIAMCEAFLMTRDCRLRASAQKGVDYMVARQHRGGGWGWAKDESRTTVSGWYLVALVTAREAGLKVPASAIVRFRSFLDDVTRTEPANQIGTNYELLRPKTQVGEALSVVDHDDVASGGNSLSTAIGLWSRLLSGGEGRDPRVQGAFASLARSLPGVGKTPAKPDERIFFGSQAALMGGGKLWANWNPAMQQGLLSIQVRDKCERGSWKPSDDTHGRVFSTALGALTLESYYRFTKPVD